MTLRSGLLILCCLLLSAVSALAAATTRRYGLAVGANDGGADRPTLKYAVSDAESFARVMETLGGVSSSDLVLLKQPSLIELEDALEDLRHRVDSPPEEEAENRTQVVVYFSGHANETGLLLGEETFSYRSLRNWMDLVEADVRIAVLDACASGAITRLKGSRRRKVFLVDTSSEMRGHAFLTSSSADEAAQESDRIRASFFTHYLVSGLRGAADTSGEGKVTLSEAYQFAFHETLGHTAKTQAGPQHPSYDINLSGTGDVVMTDIRGTSAVLVLSEELSGRFFVRDSEEQLVVELFKRQGRSVELGLESGTYSVRCENEAGSSVSTAALKEGGQFVLGSQHFAAVKREPTLVRGGEGGHPGFGGLAGRWRFGTTLGRWFSGGMGEDNSNYSFDSANNMIGGTVSYWLTEKWSLEATARTPVNFVRKNRFSPEDSYVASFLIGGRRYFPSFRKLGPTFKPYLTVAGGAYLRHAVTLDREDILHRAGGGMVGGGFDMQLARWCMVGTKLRYNFTADFQDDFTGTFGNKTNYHGFELEIDFSFLLGKGKTPGL